MLIYLYRDPEVNITNIFQVLPRTSICFPFAIEAFWENKEPKFWTQKRQTISPNTANLSRFLINISEHQWEHTMSSHYRNVSTNFQLSLTLQGLLERNILFPIFQLLFSKVKIIELVQSCLLLSFFFKLGKEI